MFTYVVRLIINMKDGIDQKPCVRHWITRSLYVHYSTSNQKIVCLIQQSYLCALMSHVKHCETYRLDIGITDLKSHSVMKVSEAFSHSSHESKTFEVFK